MSRQYASGATHRSRAALLTVAVQEYITVVLAVIRGLLRDPGATGNTTRTHRAFAGFLTTIDSA
jgi:hypothetical protein